MTTHIESLYGLSVLMGSSTSVRAGLIDWARASRDPIVTRVGRRARLGLPLTAVVEPLEAWPDGRVVANAIEAHALHGGSLGATLQSIVSVLRERDQMIHESRVASASSMLSGRLMGGLAVLCAIGLVMRARSMTVATIVAMLVAGGLVWVGMRWSRRLTPKPPRADRAAAATADLVAALLDAGLHIPGALELVWDSEDKATRLVRLGMTWTDAIERSSDAEMQQVAAELRRCSATGSPVADALRHLASNIRAAKRREAEFVAKRAPVMLVLPLTLCFLPAFALVLVAPMIGAMSG